MRQGQQNRRSRGRGRKNQNPLSRNYESNGPDVKIRGTASHVADKYSALARDALSSGDPITAENYFQHAEHYNRIIMAAQAQNSPGNQPANDAANGAGTAQPEMADVSQSDQSAKSLPDEASKKRRRRSQNNGASRRPAKSKSSNSPPAEDVKKATKTNGAEASDEGESQSGESPPDGIVI